MSIHSTLFPRRAMLIGLCAVGLMACDEGGNETRNKAEPLATAPAVAETAPSSTPSTTAAPKASGSFAPQPEKTELKEALRQATAPEPLPKTGAHSPKDPHTRLGPEKLVQVALQHQAEGRPNEAMTTLDNALIKFPDQAELLSVRGSLLLQQNRPAEALRDLEAAHNARPDDPLVLVNRAQAYRQFGNETKALADLDHAIELDPDLVSARFNRGSMHFSARRFQDALADFERCIAVDPHMAPPYFNLAMTRDALGNRDGAVADLKRFLQITDQDKWREVAQQQLAVWAGNGEDAPADSKTGAQ